MLSKSVVNQSLTADMTILKTKMHTFVKKYTDYIKVLENKVKQLESEKS